MKVKVSQSGLTLCDSTVHGIFQAGILEWVAFPFSQEVFPTQGSNSGISHCRRILYQLSHQDIILFNYSFIHYYTISCTLHCKLQNQRAISTGFTCIHGAQYYAQKIINSKYLKDCLKDEAVSVSKTKINEQELGQS